MVKHILALLLLLLAACSYNISYVVEQPPGPPKKTPIIVHVDSDFSDEQQMLINRAFNAWEEAGNNSIIFRPRWYAERAGDFLSHRNSNHIFLWYLPKTESHFYPDELVDVFSIDGIVYRRYLQDQVVIFKDSPKEYFYVIALHEIGHLIGLQHIDRPSVMHVNSVSNCITKWDAHQLCDIYNCKPNPEC